MRVVMDADCLIKLTKARLKESVCAAYEVLLPPEARREVMKNAPEHPECAVIAQNLASSLLGVIPVAGGSATGEAAALAAYQRGGYDGIGSDDKRFVNRLRILGVPYITPAVFIVLLAREGHVGVPEALDKLDRLAPLVSDEEATVARLHLESLR
jgi:hypothetical protein